MLSTVTLEIYLSDREYSSVTGMEEMESEYGNSPSCLFFTLGMKEKEFRRITEMIMNKSLKSFDIMISNLTGLYAEWSPEPIIQRHIKVLLPNQSVDVPMNFDIELSRIQRVGEIEVRSIIHSI